MSFHLGVGVLPVDDDFQIHAELQGLVDDVPPNGVRSARLLANDSDSIVDKCLFGEPVSGLA